MIRRLRLSGALAVALLPAIAWGQGPLPKPEPDDPIAAVIRAQSEDRDEAAERTPEGAGAPPASPSRGAPAGSDPVAAQIAAAPPVVIDVRFGSHEGATRFVVELSDPVEYRVFTLAGPDRVVIDLPEVLWRLSVTERPEARGAVASYRYGLFRQGNSRFVVDLKQPVKVDGPRLYPPEGGYGFRLVLDLLPTTREDFEAHAGWPKEERAAPPTAVASLPPEVAPLPETQKPEGPGPAKRVIAVDAGHGGVDPGTHGPAGTLEKDVVLAVAKHLRDALDATGRYEVVLTRDSDVFIPLRERVIIARTAGADLFLSLHADSIESGKVRGASIYTLSDDASDREAAKLAEKENMSDIIAGVDLAGDNSPVAEILIDLAQRDTLNRSARLAHDVLATLGEATLVRPTTPYRSAGFAVLKAPDVPSVLIELGYLSNREDEALMVRTDWRKKVAKAIAAAVDRHFGVETVAGRAAAP